MFWPRQHYMSAYLQCFTWNEEYVCNDYFGLENNVRSSAVAIGSAAAAAAAAAPPPPPPPSVNQSLFSAAQIAVTAASLAADQQQQIISQAASSSAAPESGHQYLLQQQQQMNNRQQRNSQVASSFAAKGLISEVVDVQSGHQQTAQTSVARVETVHTTSASVHNPTVAE